MNRFFSIWLPLALCAVAVRAGETNAVQNLTLAEAHELALKNHPQIAAADYRTLAAEQVVKEARSGFSRPPIFTERRPARIRKTRASWLED